MRQNEEVVDGQAEAEGGEVCIQYFSNAFYLYFLADFCSMMHITLEVPIAEQAFSRTFVGENDFHKCSRSV